MPKFVRNNVTKEWLMERVVIDEQGHWIWQMSLIPASGYGQVRADDKNQLAHRVFYDRFVGPIPKGAQVLHSCAKTRPPGDKYTRACCNPAHLYLGTHTQNMQDMVSDGRQSKGARHWPKTNPEALARGDRNGSRTHPERRPRGLRHYSFLKPECVAKGEDHGAAKLSETDVRNIRARAKRLEPYASIAADFNMTPEAISKVARGLTWKHVT